MRGLVRGVGTARTSATATVLLIAILLTALMPGRAAAQSASAISEQDRWIMRAALNTRLAYVITGDREVDEVNRSGLGSLSDILNAGRRWSLAPMAVDVEVDELSLFPLLYWPITEAQADLTPPAKPGSTSICVMVGHSFLIHVTGSTQRRIALGRAISGEDVRARLATAALTRNLDIPALMPLPENHVITRSFYLLDTFPGRYSGGRIYVEQGEGSSESEVSPVIIGSHDWAGAWATSEDGFYRFPVVPGGELQREMAFRSGVNLVMYVLTGNYKADQVHIPAILERLGQ